MAQEEAEKRVVEYEDADYEEYYEEYYEDGSGDGSGEGSGEGDVESRVFGGGRLGPGAGGLRRPWLGVSMLGLKATPMPSSARPS